MNLAPVSLDPEHQLKTLELARQRADAGVAVFVILRPQHGRKVHDGHTRLSILLKKY